MSTDKVTVKMQKARIAPGLFVCQKKKKKKRKE